MTLLCCTSRSTFTLLVKVVSEEKKNPLSPLEFWIVHHLHPLLMFLVCFLEGLMHMRKKNRIYFNLYLIFIFYNKLPETGVFFVFIRSQILGEPMFKDVHLNVGGKKMYPVSLCLFLCVKKKRCKRRSWRD